MRQNEWPHGFFVLGSSHMRTCVVRQSFGRHRPKSPSHSPPSPCPSRPPSAGPWQFKQLRSVGGGRNFESVFQGLKATSSPGSCLPLSRRRYPRFPDLRPIGTPIPDSRPNRETGDFPIPDFGRIGNRGFPPRFPAKKSGIGADSGDPIPDSRVSPSINRSELGVYSAASIMPVLSQAACGSYSGSKDGACCCE